MWVACEAACYFLCEDYNIVRLVFPCTSSVTLEDHFCQMFYGILQLSLCLTMAFICCNAQFYNSFLLLLLCNEWNCNSNHSQTFCIMMLGGL